MCGPVIDGDGEAVVQSDGDILMHSGSFPCPPKEVMAEPVAVESTRPDSVAIYFDFDADVPNSAGDEALLRIISNLESLSPQQVNVSGHADRAGTEVYNQDLSQRRADNVAKRLIGGGIEASKVKVNAFGETQPAVPTEDGVREPANRRAVVDLDF
jgi:outer membrane protein OmpA-like peptidoglycan-associated protein